MMLNRNTFIIEEANGEKPFSFQSSAYGNETILGLAFSLQALSTRHQVTEDFVSVAIILAE